MKIKPFHICLAIFALLASVGDSVAQESISPLLEGMESDKNKGAEYNTFNEGESSTNTQKLPTTSTLRDTIRTRPYQVKAKTNQSKPEEASSKAEDSVLGFNFLYYIFQKYKMSDIID